MTEIVRGETNVLTVLFFSAPNVPTDVDPGSLVLEVLKLSDSSTALGPVSSGFGNPATGVYTYPWNVPLSQDVGDYLALWSATVSGAGIFANEELEVVSGPGGNDFYKPGPCAPYDYVSFCPIPLATAAVSGDALRAASEIIYYGSAQRFDECLVTLRPCRRDCYGDFSGYQSWWWNGSWPRPLNINGQWYNMTCGSCGDNCSCTAISETVLPGPVREVTQVTVDGVVLTPDVDYRLDNYRRLVRLGDIWPFCNDLNKDIDQPGTWSVTAVYGEPLPALGRLALGELFCEILADLAGAQCLLPPNVTQLTRQGVSMTFETAQEALESGFEGLKYVDRFFARYNPHKLMARATAYDIDSPGFRVTGTRIT